MSVPGHAKSKDLRSLCRAGGGSQCGGRHNDRYSSVGDRDTPNFGACSHGSGGFPGANGHADGQAHAAVAAEKDAVTTARAGGAHPAAGSSHRPSNAQAARACTHT
ncbi:MAG: hypothetical protein WBJ08_05010, partial [Kiritimatiellia bacterium]